MAEGDSTLPSASSLPKCLLQRGPGQVETGHSIRVSHTGAGTQAPEPLLPLARGPCTQVSCCHLPGEGPWATWDLLQLWAPGWDVPVARASQDLQVSVLGWLWARACPRHQLTPQPDASRGPPRPGTQRLGDFLSQPPVAAAQGQAGWPWVGTRPTGPQLGTEPCSPWLSVGSQHGSAIPALRSWVPLPRPQGKVSPELAGASVRGPSHRGCRAGWVGGGTQGVGEPRPVTSKQAFLSL